MKTKWTAQQANDWYNELGWLRGCNFIGSDCANRLDMWQSYKCEEKLATADRELALANKIGFNTVRLWANFDVYYAEPESFMNIFERYISLCHKHNQKVMVVLGYEEDLPRGDIFIPKKLGEQQYCLGEHQGRIPLSKEEQALEPHHYMEYPELKDQFIEMVKRIVRKYRDDERVICWNVFNEPGIQRGDLAVEFLDTLFEVVREEDPIQPLCADIWRGLRSDGKPKTKEETRALELSDVISFHAYSKYPRFVETLCELKKLGRPVLATEWLHRINHNNVAEIYPMLYIENVASYCWGFVVGKTQTNEPWDILWKQYEEEGKNYDFTKWQHDLFRPNLRPYDPREIELIEHFNKLADKNHTI